LIQLKQDYQYNLIQLEQKIKMLKIIIFNGSKGLNAIDNPSKSNKDSLITHLSKIAEVPTFDPIQND
jgi:hypothetical protein